MIIPFLIRALLEEESVVISGFGLFSVKHLTSQIREDIIYPPQNIIEFEFLKEIEDFSFVSKLSQWKQLRIDEAQSEISEWVNLIETGLEHNKSVFFDDFGTFSKDAYGKIVFQGMLVAQLNIENEGLEPVILPQTNEDNRNNTDKRVIDKRIVLHNKHKKRDRYLFVSIISTAILILCLLFLKNDLCEFYHKIFLNDKPAVTHNDFPIEDEFINDETLPDEILPDETLKEEKKETTQPISLSTYKELYLPYQKGNYYIIAGSFTKEESALLHIKQKKLDKLNAKLIVHPDSPRIRVCIGVFDNEEEAIKNAAQLNKNYWVLK
ncbi:MAG: hypothetical protein FWF70_02745 [Bacteroidetes bacterium]|nr:hypothetical protein [Bacteroidota bacterium]MCL1969117.1 hypothetical protein [Bacteroidota bacterium]